MGDILIASKNVKVAVNLSISPHMAVDLSDHAGIPVTNVFRGTVAP